MIQTKTTAMILLVAIAAIGAIGIGIGTTTQSAHAASSFSIQQNPATANPHPPATLALPAEPTGNPHQLSTSCGGDPHGQIGAETITGSPLPQCNGSK